MTDELLGKKKTPHLKTFEIIPHHNGVKLEIKKKREREKKQDSTKCCLQKPHFIYLVWVCLHACVCAYALASAFPGHRFLSPYVGHYSHYFPHAF